MGIKKAGDEFGKSAYNIPETGPLIKDMSKKITSTLREELSKKYQSRFQSLEIMEI